jgi:hypothetical protein
MREPGTAELRLVTFIEKKVCAWLGWYPELSGYQSGYQSGYLTVSSKQKFTLPLPARTAMRFDGDLSQPLFTTRWWKSPPYTNSLVTVMVALN